MIQKRHHIDACSALDIFNGCCYLFLFVLSLCICLTCSYLFLPVLFDADADADADAHVTTCVRAHSGTSEYFEILLGTWSYFLVL